MPHWANSLWHTNRVKHDKERANPRRENLLLNNAIQAIGLKVIGYEQEFKAEWGPLWYDAAVEIKGKTCVIFLRDYRALEPLSYKWKPLNLQARQRKIAYAKSVGMPFLEVWPTSQSSIQAQIELWLAFIDRQPYREAGKRMPKDLQANHPSFTKAKRGRKI